MFFAFQGKSALTRSSPFKILNNSEKPRSSDLGAISPQSFQAIETGKRNVFPGVRIICPKQFEYAKMSCEQVRCRSNGQQAAKQITRVGAGGEKRRRGFGSAFSKTRNHKSPSIQQIETFGGRICCATLQVGWVAPEQASMGRETVNWVRVDAASAYYLDHPGYVLLISAAPFFLALLSRVCTTAQLLGFTLQ